MIFGNSMWGFSTDKKLFPLLKDTVVTEDGELNYFLSKLDLQGSKGEIFDLLTELHFCDCCERHQIDKPCLPNKWIEKDMIWSDPNFCRCDCRHMARMICRMCD